MGGNSLALIFFPLFLVMIVLEGGFPFLAGETISMSRPQS
jgi:hypothetical protein